MISNLYCVNVLQDFVCDTIYPIHNYMDWSDFSALLVNIWNGNSLKLPRKTVRFNLWPGMCRGCQGLFLSLIKMEPTWPPSCSPWSFSCQMKMNVNRAYSWCFFQSCHHTLGLFSQSKTIEGFETLSQHLPPYIIIRRKSNGARFQLRPCITPVSIQIQSREAKIV